MLNPFDHAIITYINQFCGKYEVLDRTMIFLTTNDLFKGSIILALFWWEWFKPVNNLVIKRERIISGFLGSCIGMFVVRAVVMSGHFFRSRPMLNPANHLVQPLGWGIDLSKLENTHNSFPSDHGTMFFALATGLFFVSRRMGIFSFIYVALFIAFPRIYCGLHYPTDMIAGALIGIVFVYIFNLEYLRSKLSARLFRYSETKPELFYMTFFLVSFQIGTLFDSGRSFIHFLGTLLKVK